jgi:hypothetical protein
LKLCVEKFDENLFMTRFKPVPGTACLETSASATLLRTYMDWHKLDYKNCNLGRGALSQENGHNTQVLALKLRASAFNMKNRRFKALQRNEALDLVKASVETAR